MKKLKLFALTAVALMGVTGVANAETVMLAQDDFVGISFWLVSMACLAATVPISERVKAKPIAQSIFLIFIYCSP